MVNLYGLVCRISMISIINKFLAPESLIIVFRLLYGGGCCASKRFALRLKVGQSLPCNEAVDTTLIRDSRSERPPSCFFGFPRSLTLHAANYTWTLNRWRTGWSQNWHPGEAEGVERSVPVSVSSASPVFSFFSLFFSSSSLLLFLSLFLSLPLIGRLGCLRMLVLKWDMGFYPCTPSQPFLCSCLGPLIYLH